MNDVPPSQEPSDDDIDTLYRRASALDPSRPSAGVSRAILAHAALVSAERTLQRAPSSTSTTRARTRRTWWRPAVFGTLAAAVLAGLFVLPNVRTSYLAPKTYSQVVRQEATSTPADPSQSSFQSAPATAPTLPAARVSPRAQAPAATEAPLRAPGASTAPVASPASPDEATSARATESFAAATPGPPLAAVPAAPPTSPAGSTTTAPRTDARFARSIAPTPAAAPKAKASRKPTANEPATNSQPLAAADAKGLQQAPLVDITVTAQRRTQSDMVTSSPISSIAADSLSTTGVAPPDIQFSSPARLHLAAERGDLKTLQAALDQLTDINSRDATGRTALLLATLHKKTEAVTMLLAHGADPNIADANGLTPLQAATKSGKSAIIDALKGAGAH